MKAFVVRIVPNMFVFTKRRICSAKPFKRTRETRASIVEHHIDLARSHDSCRHTLDFMRISDIQRHQLNARNITECLFLLWFAHGGNDFPALANSFAVARPKPDEAPVMKIVLWS